jgi:hypothetical protein
MRSLILLVLIAAVMTLLLAVTTISTVSSQTEIPLEEVGNESENETRTETDPDGLEQMTLKAQLKPHENEFLADDGYYEIKKFGFVSSNGSELCSSNDCKYGVEEGQFNPNFSGGYSFSGKLKVTTQDGEVKKSKFYNFDVSFDKTGEEERDGETLQFLEGTFELGGDTFNPEISYDVTNATLKVDEKSPVLTIQGERSPF